MCLSQDRNMLSIICRWFYFYCYPYNAFAIDWVNSGILWIVSWKSYHISYFIWLISFEQIEWCDAFLLLNLGYCSNCPKGVINKHSLLIMRRCSLVKTYSCFLYSNVLAVLNRVSCRFECKKSWLFQEKIDYKRNIQTVQQNWPCLVDISSYRLLNC